MHYIGDTIDRANTRAQEFTDDALAAQRRRAQAQSAHPGTSHCTDCGTPIPEKRRLALPGAHLCIACADIAEREQALRGARP